MKIKVKAHFRKQGRQRVFVKMHNRKIERRFSHHSLEEQVMEMNKEKRRKLMSEMMFKDTRKDVSEMLGIPEEEVSRAVIEITPKKERKRNFGAKPNFAFERIPPVEGKSGRSNRFKLISCPRCGAQLKRAGGCPRCGTDMIGAISFSSFTDLGPVSESLDKAEEELRRRKIMETRKIEAMPIETLPEFEKKEQAKERFEKDIREEEQLLKKARGGLGDG